MMNRLGRSLALVVAFEGVLGCATEQEVLSSDPRETLLPPKADAGEPFVVGPMTDVDARAPEVAIDANLAPAPDATLDAAVEREVCDGTDNDGNGTIDDVDVGHDGVCDCLLIATLGKPGGSGGGTVFGSWLAQRSDNGATSLADRVLTPELLAKYQVIVALDVHDQRAYAAEELDALSAWVNAGGGLLTLIGYADPSERTNANAILARFGLDYGSAPILSTNSAKSQPVRTWVPHPVTAGVSAVGINNGYEVRGDGTTLASEAGFVVMKAKQPGMGHLLVWGDEWISYDSEWKNNSDYQVEQLWLNMIRWLTASRVCQVPPIVL